MFERFTEKALRVILLAQEEARSSGHNFVGTEQLLLGLIGEGSGIGSNALKNAGVKLTDARKEVERLIGKGTGFVAVEIPFTPRAKKILEQSLQQARAFNHSYIGTEHMLLALLEDTEGVAIRILTNLKVDINKVRRILLQEVGQIVDAAGLAMKKKDDELDKKIKDVKDRDRERKKAEKAEKARKDAEFRKERVKIFREKVGLKSLYYDSGFGEGDDEEFDSDDENEEEYDNENSQEISNPKELDNKDQESDDFRLFFKKELIDLFGVKVEPPPAPVIETPTLKEFTTNLNSLASQGEIDPVIGRDKEVERVVQILSRRRKNNPVLIGEPGVGKTAVAEGLALKIHNQEVASCLANKEVAVLDIGLLLAGTKYRGEFEERLKRIMDEVKAKKSLILVIDEVHTLVGAGAAEGALDAANILKPALARGELQCIGATTIDEYKQIEKDPALERRFQPVFVNEPTKEETFQILRGLRWRYENFHHVRLPDSTLKLTIDMSCNYIKDRFLPDKAIDLVDEASARVKIANLVGIQGVASHLEKDLLKILDDKDFAVRSQDFERAAKLRDKEMIIRTQITTLVKSSKISKKVVNDQSTLPIVGIDEVSDVVSAWTGIPLNKLGKDERKRLLNMEKEMHSRVIGQNKAVTAICSAIKRSRVGIKNPTRPIASFLFCGPTGVGKTELTKTLAQYFFGSEDAMVRFDMSEFMERHTVAKLIGSPPGYVGYNEGGQLTEAIRRKAYSLVLFDEVEKAHPDIFNLLLQVLDDGRLTDSKGKRIDFTNTIIIMTSNLGSQHIVNSSAEKEKKLSGYDDISYSLGETIEKEKPGYEKRLDGIRKKVRQQYQEVFEFNNQEDNTPFEENDLESDVMQLNLTKFIDDKEKKKELEEEYLKMEELVKTEIKSFFRPEFINRIDEIIVFEKLKKDEVAQICTLMLKQLSKRLREGNTVLHVDDNAKNYVVDEGYDPVYGARPMRRAITSLIEDPVSTKILETPLLTLRNLVSVEYDKIRKIRVNVYPLPSFVLSPYNKDIIDSPENDKAIEFYLKILKQWKAEGISPKNRLNLYYDYDEEYKETEENEEEDVKLAKRELKTSIKKLVFDKNSKNQTNIDDNDKETGDRKSVV